MCFSQNRTYIWNYVTSFGSYIQPFPNWYVVGPNIQYFAAHGVRGIFEEGSYGTSGGDMDALKDYVMGRMLWWVKTLLLRHFMYKNEHFTKTGSGQT
jgi:hypothetical protein